MLQVLGAEPTSLAELQGQGGSPGSTLRARLKEMVDAGVVTARRSGGFPRGSVEYELTPAGEELRVVIDILERWLAESPNASRPLGGNGAKAAIGALLEAWCATLLRALAAKPLSVADLDSLISTFNYPSLERRITAMRRVGQVEARAVNGRETPYAVTPWLRRAVAPLLAAIRWERMHSDAAGVPIVGMDVEALFLLAMPLLELHGELSGSCRLAVELPNGGTQRIAGVLVGLEDGVVATCTSRLDGHADAWASGSVSAWCRALIDHDWASLELGGYGGLSQALVEGLHRALFVSPVPERDEAVFV